MSGPRRFVAGASCPACGRLDKLILVVGDVARIRECVACGFRDELPRNAGAGAGRSAAAAPDVIRLLDAENDAGG